MPTDGQGTEAPVPSSMLAEMELESLGIGIKSAQQIFETMANVTGIPANQAEIAAGYEAYFASLTPEERSRDLNANLPNGLTLTIIGQC